MRQPDRVRGLLHDSSDFLDGEFATSFQTCTEGFAVDVTHDEIHQPPFLTDRMDRNDVGVGQPRRSLRLANETSSYLGAECKIGGQDLDGDSALESVVTRRVHDAHPAATDLTFDRVVLADRVGESRCE